MRAWSAGSLASSIAGVKPSWLAVASVFAVAFLERAVNLGRWPNNFRPTLEFDSANSARTLYLTFISHSAPWQQAWLDARLGRFIEPPVTQTLTMLTYVPGGVERPWTSWLFTVAFWFLGAAFLFSAVRRLTGIWGGVMALAYILLVPFGVGVSQSFQPEALLLLSVSVVIWYATRGDVTQGRRFFVAAVLGALAALAKPGILLPVITMMYAYSAIQGESLRDVRRLLEPGRALRLALLIAIVALPAVLYALLVIPQDLGQKVIPDLLLKPDYYRHVAGNVVKVAGILPLLGAALGFVVAPRLRLLTIAYAVAYAGFCAIFTYHSMTHDYYHLIALPIVAICLGGLGQWLAEVAARANGRAIRWRGLAAAAAVILAFVFTYALALRVSPDYLLWNAPNCGLQICPADQARFEALGERLGPGQHVLAYAPVYGKQLAYYSRLTVTAWPDASDLAYEQIQGKTSQADAQRLDGLIAAENPHYFVITTPDRCPAALRQLLAARYTPVESGAGLLVYDLTRPLGSGVPAAAAGS